jgi:IS605 OrfB family transposase
MAAVTTTAIIQIYTNAGDRQGLQETMSAYRDACNYVSEYIFETHELKQCSLNAVLYSSIREKFGLKSQMAESVIKTVIAKYKTILENQKEWIQPVFKKPQYDLVWNRDYSLGKDYFSVNTLGGRVKLPYAKEGMEKYFDHSIYKFGTAKLVHKHGKFYLHIAVTQEIPGMEFSEIARIVGIDRGINFVVATYDDEGKSTFVSGKQIKQIRSNYKKLRQELQRRGTPSSRRRLKCIGHRENRWMRDVNHCVSKALVENNPKHTLFVLEDLTGIRAATERVRVKDRYVSVSWAFYELEQMLIYKAALNESLVIKVDPRYTSQRCPKCGHTEKDNRNKKIHLFCCKKCGYRSNDDRIGAINVCCEGIDYLAHSLVPNAAIA